MARILCLDDEPRWSELLCMILERAGGHECLTTTDEQEALSIMRTQSIDLLIQDWRVEFLHQMKSNEAVNNIPVLVITARWMREKLAEQLKQVGLDMERDVAGYLTGPLPPTVLLDTVEAILEKGPKPPPAE
jgi:DNA-binding response OmpR family regulator